jgi:hypothetical protein
MSSRPRLTRWCLPRAVGDPTAVFSLIELCPLPADPDGVNQLKPRLLSFRLCILCRAIDGVLSRVRVSKKSIGTKDFVDSPFCEIVKTGYLPTLSMVDVHDPILPL